MFIWNFVADTFLGQIVDWIYGQVVGFLGDFFMQMGNMGADLFEMIWVQPIVLFFFLCEESISARIYSLMTVLKGIAEFEMLCLNSRENFEDNKRCLRSRMEQEQPPHCPKAP